MFKINKLRLNKREQRIVHAMQILGDATRFKIFKLLSSNKEYCVSDIATLLSISPSAVSQHFHKFEILGLVEKDRMGQKICYTLNKKDTLVQELKELTGL